MSNLIVQYKFDNTLYDNFPMFNDGFSYTYEDVVNGDVTTRTIYSDSLPNAVVFGYDQGATDWTNSLLEINYLDATNVTNMYAVFAFCQNLTYVNINNANIITDMSGMFYNCTNLISLDVSNFNTSNVTNMYAMFASCNSLTSLDLSNFDTSNVTSMQQMFANCNSLTSVGDLSNWDTSNATSMFEMFMCCYSLTSVGDLSNWDVSNVTNMCCMFDSCESLISLNVSNWDTSNVTDMSWMFEECYSLETIIGLDTWDVSNVTDMNGIFAEDYELTTLDISNWSLNSELYTDDYMFYDNSELDTIIMNNSDSDSVNRIIYELPTRTTDSKGTLNITGIDDISQVDIGSAESKYWNIVNDESGETKQLVAQYKFDKSIYDNLIPEFNTEFTNYEIIDEYLDTEDIIITNTETMMLMSYDAKPDKCGVLTTEYEVENINTFSAENIVTRSIYSEELPTKIKFGQGWYDDELGNPEISRSHSLLEILNMNSSNLSGNFDCMFRHCINLISINCDWNTSKATNMEMMFFNCQSLTTLDVSNWDISNVTALDGMFYGCNSLTSLDLSNWNTFNVTKMNDMFNCCYGLTTLDISNFNTSNVTRMDYMFYNCDKLTSLDVSSFDTSNVTNMSHMFLSCNSLTTLDVSNFDTTNVTDMNFMFGSDWVKGSYITSIDLSNFDMTNIVSYDNIFDGCYCLEKITINNLDTATKIIPKLPNKNEWNYKPGSLVCYDIDENLLDLQTLQAKNWTVVNEESEEQLVAQYKFDKTLYEDTLPEVNDEFKYTFEDAEDYNIVTRSIYKANNEVDVSGNIVKSLYSDSVGCPALLENGDIQFTSIYWNCCAIDLSGYNGKTVNISLTVTGKPNRWAELDVGLEENGEMTYQEMEIGVDIGETEQTFTYNKSFVIGSDTSELWLEGMYIILSDIQIMIDNENLFPNRMKRKYKLESASDYKYYSGMPLYKDNNLDYVQDRDNLYIDVHQYKDKDITISFTVTGYSNKYNWSELEIGKRNDVDDFGYYEQSIIAADLDEDYILEYNKTFTIDENVECIFIGGMGVKLSNLSMIVHNVESGPLTKIRFGYKGDDFGNENAANSLLEVNYLDTSNVTDMSYMFYNCHSLTTLDVGDWDTGNVTTMEYMFGSTDNPGNDMKITALDVSNWDTSNVTNMACMFKMCGDLTALDVSKWDTSNVINMEEMFYKCSLLTSLDVSNFNTNKVTNMHCMFYNCASLSTLDLNNFNTNNVTDMGYMFASCYKLSSLNASKWDTSNVINMGYMFSDCHSITTLDLSNWDTSNVIDFTWFFTRCYNLTSIGNISKWDTSNVTCFDSMFFECSSLSELDLSNWNTSNVVDMGYMFWGCQSLTSLDISNWDNSKVTVMDYMFNDCQLLNSIIMNNSDYNSVNTIIIQLPTRTIESPGSLNVTGIDDISQVDIVTAESKYWNIVNEEPEEPDDNELVQGDIIEDGSFNDDVTNVVRTNFIDVSDKKSIKVTVLTDNVYVSACYLYNANKELVKVIDLSSDKKRMFGVNLQDLINQVLEDEEGDK